MKREVLELKNISKSYGKIELLSSLSLVIEEGEKVALIGPSGSGKTSLLNIVSNRIGVDSGEVLIFGKNIKSYDSPTLSKQIGMVRQSLDLVPQLSVINNVLAGRLSDWSLLKSLVSLVFPREKEKAMSALREVGIEDKYDKRTSNLSGGEQQRVAIARLLLQDSKVILADEPVASLDPARAEDVLRLISDIVERNGKTFVASIHSVEYAKKYFTRVVGLRNGQVEFDIRTSELDQEKLQKLYELEVN